jgi:hypothetical protein
VTQRVRVTAIQAEPRWLDPAVGIATGAADRLKVQTAGDAWNTNA